MKKIILLFISVVLILGASYIFWPQSSNKIQVLSTAQVERGSVKQILQVTGIIKSQVGGIVKIGAQATGLITEMKVQVGDLVKKGDIIALIDQRKIKAQIQNSKAKIKALELELANLKHTYPLKIAQKEKDIARLQAEVDFWAKQVQRYQSLFKQHLVAQVELEEYVKNLKSKKEELEANRLAKEELEKEFFYTQKKLKENLKAEQANLKELLVEKSFREIKSPLTGYVSQVTAQKGETIVAGLQVANLITILDPSKLEMRIYIDETDVGQVKPGQKVSFWVDAFPQQTFEGKIKTIYPEPEIRDNIVYYLALVPLTLAQTKYLRPEMTTHCQIEIAEKQDVLRIPNQALKWVKGKEVVFKKIGKEFKPLSPTLGLRGFNYSEVITGLEKGDLVATEVVLGQSKSAQ